MPAWRSDHPADAANNMKKLIRMSEFHYLRPLSDPDHLPALRHEYVHHNPAFGLGKIDPPPRILLLYGSLRERSYSRLAVEEAARLRSEERRVEKEGVSTCGCGVWWY